MTERSARLRTSRMPAAATLVPYRDARDFILSRISLIAPREVSLYEALGKPVAMRIAAAAPIPRRPIAARRGIAVVSQDLVGASPYSPVLLTTAPAQVMPGDALPCPADAVLEEKAVTSSPGFHEIGQGAYPGEGAVLPGFDVPEGAEIVASGATVTPAILLALDLAGVTTISIRSPLVELDNPDGAATAETDWLRTALLEAGCRIAEAGAGDLRIIICRDPDSVGVAGGGSSLAGLAMNAGRETRIIWDSERRTLVLATRFDAVVAGFHALIAPALAAMTDRRLRIVERPLTAKIVSQVGMTDIALLRGTALGYEPLAVGALSLDALMRADAIGFVDPRSEGAPAGAVFPATPLKDMYEPS